MYTDHLGNKFEHLSQMAEYYNISAQTLRARLRRDMSIEDALTRRVYCNNEIQECTDHLGNKFRSIREMANHHNIGSETLRYRLKRGMSVEEALTSDVTPICTGKKSYVDHLGNKFDSLTSLCKYWNININTFRYRIQSGMSIQEALGARDTLIDHLGNEYKSYKSMASTYGISETTLLNRLKIGMSIEQSLTEPIKGKYRNTEVYDHNGMKFKSKSEMASHYGFRDYSVIQSRLDNGYTLEQALTTKSVRDASLKTDHLGNRFKSKIEMIKQYGIESISVFNRRLIMGWTLAEALEQEGRGLDAKIYRGETLNYRLMLQQGGRNRLYDYIGRDGRKYYRVEVIDTNEIKYMNSDQIKKYK